MQTVFFGLNITSNDLANSSLERKYQEKHDKIKHQLHFENKHGHN